MTTVSSNEESTNFDLGAYWAKEFLKYAATLSEDELHMLSTTRSDIYWDVDSEQFFMFMHRGNPNGRWVRVFDTTSDEDFDAEWALREWSYDVGERIFYYFEELRGLD